MSICRQAPQKGGIFTIGHSVLDFDKFCACLKAYGIQKLIDVRSHPGSRYVPQYNRETFAAKLDESQIEYSHLPTLGGRRKSCSLSDYQLVGGWKNASFKNYAAYTLTADYEAGIAELIKEASEKNVCIMCAESLPWRCHRLLISNTLFSKGIEVYHILSEKQYIRHELNKYGAFAKEQNGKIIYP